MERTLSRPVTWGMVFLCALIAGNGLLFYRNLERIVTDMHRAGNASDGLIAVDQVVDLSKDMLMGSRQFVRYGKDSGADLYRRASQGLDQQLARAEHLCDESPEQRQRLSDLEQQAHEVRQIGAALTALPKIDDPAENTRRLATMDGSETIEAMRDTAAQIHASQQTTLQAWRDEAHAHYRTALIHCINATVGALILAGAVYMLARHDRRERDRMDTLRRADAARFRRLVEANVIGVLFVNLDGRVSDANDAFLKMIGVEHDELARGQVNWRTLAPGESADAIEAAIAEVRACGVATPFEKSFVRPDASTIPCLVGVVQLEAARGDCICYAVDLTQLKQAELTITRLNRELQDGVHELETLFELLPVGLALAKDPQCHEIDVNGELAHVLGISPNANASLTPLEGHKLPGYRFVQDGRVLEPAELPMQQVAARGRSLLNQELEVVREDGSSVKLLGNVAPLFDEDGCSRGCVGIFADLTERIRMEDELRRNSQAKDALLSMLGHELRNPLAAIAGSAELISLIRPEDANYQQSLAILKRHIGQLAQLIDRMLDLTRLTSGKVRLKLETLDLRDPLRAAIDAVQPLIRERQHHLQFALPSAPVSVSADRVRLEQLFANLLTNAAQFTPPGGRIDMRLIIDGPSALVSIHDTGDGIEEASLSTLFDLFSHINPQLDRSHVGLGMGLTVARCLVELHGGKIGASSDGRGKGSVFTVQLPLAPDAVAQRQIEPHASQPAVDTSRPLRVMVVEDQPDIARVMQALIQRCGHQPNWAPTAADALAMAAQWHPNLAFVDIGLPGMNGYELAHSMKADPQLRDIRLIALTGYGQPEYLQRSQEAGFAHHLVKPINAATLAQMLKECAATEDGL